MLNSLNDKQALQSPTTGFSGLMEHPNLFTVLSQGHANACFEA